MNAKSAQQTQAKDKTVNHNEPARAEPAISRRAVDVKATHLWKEWKHKLPLTCCRLSADGRWAYAGAMDFNLYRWNVSTGQTETLTGNRSWVRCIDTTPHQPVVVAADWAGHVCVFDAESSPSKPMRSWTAHDGACRWVRFSPDGQWLATCGNDLRIKLWDFETGEEVARMIGHQRHPYAVEFHPQQPALVSQDLMGQMKVWSLPDGQLQRGWELKAMTGYDKVFAADMGGARDLSFSADGRELASAGVTNVKNAFAGIQDPIVQVVDWTSGPRKTLYKGDNGFQGICWGVRFHPDGFLMGCGANRNSRGALWFWNRDKATPDHTFNFKSAGRGFDLHTDGRHVLVAHADGGLRMYRLTAADTPAKKS